MELFASVALALGFAAALGVVGVRDHRALRKSRRSLLDGCHRSLEEARLTYGGDDFPSLSGFKDGHRVTVQLIPDTMTIRRLPQLWLSVTLLDQFKVASGFAVLVRPSGNDFYSLTESFTETLDPPASLPWEVLVRGESAKAQVLLNQLAPSLGPIFADPCIKEVAVTRKGLRIIRQAGEGRRGEHLLLRQAVFDDAAVLPGDLECLLSKLMDVREQVLEQAVKARAA